MQGFLLQIAGQHTNCSSNSNGNAAEVLVPKIMIEISSLFFRKATGSKTEIPLVSRMVSFKKKPL